MEIKHKKEVDYEVVDAPNSEQIGGGGKGNNSPLKNNKNTWIAVAILTILITLILVLLNV